MASLTIAYVNSPLPENHPGSSNELSSITATHSLGWEPRYFPMETLLPGKNHSASYFSAVFGFRE